MLVHYNILAHPTWKLGSSIATFHFGNCEIEDMIKVARMINELIPVRTAKVFFCDWMWDIAQGTVKIESAPGCEVETFEEVCERLLKHIKGMYEN